VPSEYNPYLVYFERPDGLLQPSVREDASIQSRQQLPRAYHRDGSVFVTRTQTVVASHSLNGKRTLGAISPEDEAVDLDTDEQWQSLERRLRVARESEAERPFGR
jgi:CMP-N-acetylneuraminic acid synthetase